MHNKKYKTSKVKKKNGMIGQAKSHALGLGLAHDFKHAQYESKVILKMMLKKEWLCNMFELFS
jgi:transketolase N-terminal domain/subunit